MFRLARAAVLTIALLGSAREAQSRGTWVYRTVATTPGFPGFRPYLQSLVDRFGPPGTSHFCAVVETEAGVKIPNINTTAYTYWREKRRIEAIHATTAPRLDDSVLGADAIDLRSDIIGENGQTGLSPSSLTRAELNDLLSHCRRDGTFFTMVRRARR